MVRFIRSIEAIGERNGDVAQFAVEVTAYINGKFPKAKFQVFTGIFGTRNKFYWMNDQKSLAEVEKLWTAIEADEGFQEILAKTGGMFVQGTLQDEVFSTLE